MHSSYDAAAARGPELIVQPRPRLFAAVWRWHFYAGLLSIPILVVLCLSGIVYLFKPQIDDLAYGHLRTVEPTQRAVSYGDQMAAVRRAVPGATVTGVGPPPAPDRSTEFAVTTRQGAEWTVYVDPGSGRVLGHRDNRRALTTLALDLHGTLLASRFMDEEGVWGDRLIELTASWSVVLVVTGVLFSFVFLFFLVTGLAWSGVWGEGYVKVATSLGADRPPETFDGVPSEKIEDVVEGGKPAWSAGELPVARSQDEGTSGRPGHTGHTGHRHPGGLRWDPRDGAPLDAVIGRAQAMGFPPGYSVTFPEDATGSYAVSLSPDLDPQPNQSALDERFAFVDQYTARPLGDYRFADFGPMAQASDLGIALHEGRQFGLLNQLLTLAATLALLVSMATALVMWRKRRPRGIGAPRRPPDRRLGAGVVAITFGLGLLFPLLGLSIVALLVFDWLVVRRVPPVARAFGGAGYGLVKTGATATACARPPPSPRRSGSRGTWARRPRPAGRCACARRAGRGRCGPAPRGRR